MIRITDGQINEATRDVLGAWPDFGTQSWACKVVRAVAMKHTVGSWRPIPRDGIIDHDEMILVRKVSERRPGTYNAEIAYKTVSGTWALQQNSGGISAFQEWAPMP